MMTRQKLAALVWTMLVLAACLVPGRWLNRAERLYEFRLVSLDKVVHAGLFAGFGFFWARARRARLGFRWVVATGLALAVLTELAQGSPLIERDPDLYDGLADAVGLLLGLLAGRLLAGERVAEETEVVA